MLDNASAIVPVPVSVIWRLEEGSPLFVNDPPLASNITVTFDPAAFAVTVVCAFKVSENAAVTVVVPVALQAILT